MGLIKCIDNTTATDLFSEIGLVKCNPVNIVLKGDAKPHCITAASMVPKPLHDAVKTELEHIEVLGITTKITEPTPWCAPMVPVFCKNGKIHICVNLKRLNWSVTRENYTLPVLDDILHGLAGSTIISRLDAASGFWQIPLAEDNAKLTTFIMLFGRYYF